MIYRAAQRVGLLSEVDQALVDLSSGIKSIQGVAGNFSSQANAVASDVHAMRESLNFWLKVIGGTLIGMTGVMVANAILSRKR